MELGGERVGVVYGLGYTWYRGITTSVRNVKRRKGSRRRTNAQGWARRDVCYGGLDIHRRVYTRQKVLLCAGVHTNFEGG